MKEEEEEEEEEEELWRASTEKTDRNCGVRVRLPFATSRGNKKKRENSNDFVQ